LNLEFTQNSLEQKWVKVILSFGGNYRGKNEQNIGPYYLSQPIDLAFYFYLI